MLGKANDETAAAFRLRPDPLFRRQRFLAADMIMALSFSTMRLFAPRDLAPSPNIRAHLQRIGDRPAFQRAMHKADPDLPLQLS